MLFGISFGPLVETPLEGPVTIPGFWEPLIPGAPPDLEGAEKPVTAAEASEFDPGLGVVARSRGTTSAKWSENNLFSGLSPLSPMFYLLLWTVAMARALNYVCSTQILQTGSARLRKDLYSSIPTPSRNKTFI